MNTKGKANSVDQHVGSMVRQIRKKKGLSQEALAEHLGITFQQIQKYENGKNRIAAGRLHTMSKVLKTPVQRFFPKV